MAAGRLEYEIKQTKPFDSIEQELFLSVVKTSDLLLHALEKQFRSIEITPTHYNVLRILRGAGPEGLPCMEVGRRLVNSVPDITRLLNRMDRFGYVHRVKATRDRRIVTVTITERGRQVCLQADDQVRSFFHQFLSHVAHGDARRMIADLEGIREVLESSASE